MGIEHNHVVIATTWNDEAVNKVKAWIAGYNDAEQESLHELKKLFLFSESVVNSKTTVILAPDGSKEGWGLSNDGNRLRKAFIKQLKENWEWVEVGYGELGSKLYRASDMEERDVPVP